MLTYIVLSASREGMFLETLLLYLCLVGKVQSPKHGKDVRLWRETFFLSPSFTEVKLTKLQDTESVHPTETLLEGHNV